MAPPALSLYRPGMNYGAHADAAFLPIGARPIRADLSCTIFLTEPADYDGGELSVRLGTREVDFKPAPGGAVLYPSTTIHQVRPVTRGERLASFFWIQSMVRDPERRRMLFDMDMAILALRTEYGEIGPAVTLTSCYHNLLRMWAEV